jgi:seryl-tRNA synthetase
VIDIRAIREAPDAVRAALARRHPALADRVQAALGLDQRRRELLVEVERLKALRNTQSTEVARRKKAGEGADALLGELKALSDRIKAFDAETADVDSGLAEILLQLPNLPLADVPSGDASANAVLRTWGAPAEFAVPPRPHWELGQALGLFDLPTGAKIAGSGFPLFTGAGARLGRALANFMLDLHTREHGYLEVQPPLLVNADSARGTGQLPDHEQNMYVTADGYYLIPTAEVPVTNIHRDDLLTADQLPLGYAACTPCFRREAGAHGKDTRGLIRVHQFDKVELVRLTRPEDSPAEHERLLGHAEEVLRRLGLTYRVVLLATGDLGFASAKTYDLEVWAPGVGAWLEVSSASTFTDFQARRANIRYRPAAGAKPAHVHTLNASALAFPRTIIALLESGQQPDGSVLLPAALHPYIGVERLTPGGR